MAERAARQFQDVGGKSAGDSTQTQQGDRTSASASTSESPAPGSDAAALLASVTQLSRREAEMKRNDHDQELDMLPSPSPSLGRRGTVAVSAPQINQSIKINQAMLVVGDVLHEACLTWLCLCHVSHVSHISRVSHGVLCCVVLSWLFFSRLSRHATPHHTYHTYHTYHIYHMYQDSLVPLLWLPPNGSIFPWKHSVSIRTIVFAYTIRRPLVALKAAFLT